MRTPDRPGQDHLSVEELVRQEVYKFLSDRLMQKNLQLQNTVRMQEEEIAALNARNEQLSEGLMLAVSYIERLHQEQTKDLLASLGVADNILSNPQSEERTLLVQALRQTLKITHPDRHPQEPSLVKKALGILSSPVTSALTTLRRSDSRRLNIQ